MPKQTQKPKHIPVLLEETLRILNPKAGETYLDTTAGYGGHARKVLNLTDKYSGSVLVDRDDEAQATLENEFGDTEIIRLRDNYLSASQKLESEGRTFDMILADVGISSPHIDNASRGFSFAKESSKLDMRMDRRQELTAETIVNTYDEVNLAKIIYECGEEPRSRAIARAIVAKRPIDSTHKLAQIVANLYGGKSKRHPATRTFQALRVAVNDELGQLRDSLPVWLRLLNPGGRLVVITFHSLEDRIVKQFFQEVAGEGYDSEYRLLNKHPLTAAPTELVHNPRARSAKLRGVVKIKK